LASQLVFQFPCQLHAFRKGKKFRSLFGVLRIFEELFRTQILRFAQSLCGAQGLSLMIQN